MSVPSLRDELGVRPDPEFEMNLPAGWSRQEPDEETQARMLAAVKRRLMESHRPDLFAQMKTALDQAFEDMRKNGVFAFFSATDPGPDTLFVPSSLNASILRAEPERSLDDVARTLFSSHGATPLFGDKRTLRAEKEKNTRMGTDTVINHSVVYLTPIPGSKRRRALQLVAGFARKPEMAPDDPWVDSMRLLFDSCVSSLRWRPPTQ
ncbi:protein TPRXL [Ruania alkalisoli]|uniref:Protein TPRXL n=1 Tax=Ruania alkalisoli TaxID=2779775 RepID=A0A7M1SWG6_9MICO|nr:protein TPRXL [Ruania alkalisoli]QOR71294.1 protein TPRXL [Ruania alkalisoli]